MPTKRENGNGEFDKKPCVESEGFRAAPSNCINGSPLDWRMESCTLSKLHDFGLACALYHTQKKKVTVVDADVLLCTTDFDGWYDV